MVIPGYSQVVTIVKHLFRTVQLTQKGEAPTKTPSSANVHDLSPPHHALRKGVVCAGIAGLPCPEGSYCRLEVGTCCCDFQGVCAPVPDACADVFDPVCGCDRQTYANACLAAQARVSLDHVGSCAAEP